MWILASAYCRVTGKEITAGNIYHLQGDRAGVPDSYCRCHDKKVCHEQPLPDPPLPDPPQEER